MNRVLSFFWSAGSALVRRLCELGWLRVKDLGVRVISVGNIQAGGAGKTPLTIFLAREAVARGLRVCILTRGYRGRREREGGVISPSAGAISAEEWGDEPALIHDFVPQAFLGVGADRIDTFKKVIEKEGLPDLVILDDGFQHWRIKKDCELVAITSRRWGEVLFRDFRGALRKADLVVLTKGQGAAEAQVRVRFEVPQAAKDQTNRIWLVTGVGEPEAVRQSVEVAGWVVERHSVFADHHPFNATFVRECERAAMQEGWAVALTGKDWVKWRQFGGSAVKVVVLEPELQFLEGREHWNRVLWG